MQTDFNQMNDPAAPRSSPSSRGGNVELATLSSNASNNNKNNNSNDDDDGDYLHAVMGRNKYAFNNDTTNASSSQQHQKKLSKPNKQAGIAGASANLINSIVGAGIIGIPYALRQSGLIAGILLLILVAYLTDKSLRIIVELASFHPNLKNRDVRTFEDLAMYPFGMLGSNFILVNMFVMAYGAMVAYLLIIKDTIPHILGVGSYLERTLIMLVTSITIMVPLAMQRDMASLAITSLFSVLADVVLVAFIVGFSPIAESVENAGGFGTVLINDSINPTLFVGLGILSTAMACQHSAFIVSGSLKNKTMDRWAKVTGFSITLSAILCMVLGVAGYLGFLENTESDVLNNFDADSVLANVARFLLAITMLFTYPMESFVARHVMIQLVHDGDMDGRDDPNHSGAEGEEAGGFWICNRRQTWTIAIYLLTLLPALIVDDLGPVLSITGSLGGGCIAYMGPGLCYLAINGSEFLVFADNLLRKKTNIGSGVTEADLPVDGDSNRVIDANRSVEAIQSGPKPIWWYLGLFPLWCKIASVGQANMINRLNDEGAEVTSAPQDADDEDVTIPNGREFCIAIFFIIFGVIAVFAGVISNVYVQVVTE